MTFLNKILHFFKNKKYVWVVVTIILIIAGVFFLNNKNGEEKTITISHSNFVNSVSISGKVIAAEDVDLSFKNSGVIDRIYFSVGGGTTEEQIIKAGTLIAKIDAKDAEKEVEDAEIGLESAKLALAKLKLESSDENLNADLEKAYDDGFTAVSDAFLDLSTIIIGLEEVLNEDNISDNAARSSGNTAIDYREQADKLFYAAQNEFEKNRKDFRLLNRDSSESEIEIIINKTYETTKLFSDAIKSAKNVVDYLAEDTGRESEFTASKNTLSAYNSTVSGHLTDLLSIRNDIKNYKDAFSGTSFDIKDAELLVKQKENDLQDAKNKLSDYYIRAPFDGVITNIDAEVGERVSSGIPLITMMSADTFQIESFVPEVNIALIKLGDKAEVTLDAYGESVFFDAQVVTIDPAETIRDGISTYKIKLQFSTKDSRIKSGMTANVSIVTFDKPNVIVVPGGVVFDKEGKKFVQVKNNKEILDREIFLGSVSSLGQVEVVAGLEDGDLVILNPNIK
jgi:HlyD family secretion protein